ncbi:MAG: MBL fold metallo-hydrolase [Tissierellia bacterium]|nr:MBL fold metallo-hydrolase [Tissierellia bacterium]
MQNIFKYILGFSGNKRPIKLATLLLIISILALGIIGCTDLSELDVVGEPVEEEVDQIEGTLRVHYIDVGQGDSIYIELPNGEIALIDGGPKSSEEALLNYLDEQGVEKIDYLVATHPHEDHIGGLVGVIKNYEIGKIYMPNVVHTTKTFENLLLAIQDKGYKITKAMAEDTIIDEAGLSLYILAPEIDADWEDLNNYSIVLKLNYKNNSFLFTGDAERESEEIMLTKGYDLRAHVLKVGHHGSTTSTMDEFLDKVDPQYAIISCGVDNKYGHPHKEIVAKLQERNIKIYRTDLDGNIVVKSDGENISFNE